MTVTIRRSPSVLLLVLTTLLSGCHDTGPNPGLATVPVRVGDRTFTLEIANTEETRRTGLMHRESMPGDHGMVFVFPDEQVRGFWMKNTKIPLDILYLNGVGRVVSIKQMQPMDETSVSSDAPARFAIELNQGTADKVGVKPGHVITLPARARVAEE
jgi:uncharacterized membrane protein (UPF0127 family)